NVESQLLEQPRLKLDRDTSVDTGYPASLGTPILGLEADMKQHIGPVVQSGQDLSHSNQSHQQELTSDSDSGTEEDVLDRGDQENGILNH
ncbi:hypothetical protein chiPu_0023422, partial [Chiloscyllium punctatum]|nr:hypothetical protein [Chiloscyllium punctatum]